MWYNKHIIEGRGEQMKSEGHGTLTFLGVVMIIFGLVYALLGTLSLMGTITGVLPGHEEQEIIVVIYIKCWKTVIVKIYVSSNKICIFVFYSIS